MNPYEWLVAFDTDQIKHYLFATNKLKEIRGASTLLDRLNLDRTHQVIQAACPAAQQVYAGGGGALYIAPGQAEAEAICRTVEHLYREETVTASITGAFLPLAPATRELGFGARVQDLAYVLRRNKDQKAVLPDVPMAPYEHVCDACGMHAARKVSQTEDGTQLVCESCDKKRASAAGLGSQDVAIPEDFEALGDLSVPQGYMGFVYADGNNIGQRLSHLDRVHDYRQFSKGLRKLMCDALAAALANVPQRKGMLPAIPLLLGGDDLMAVVAADQALEVTLKLAREFEVGSSGLLAQVGLPANPPLTLSAGVVLAHASYPVTELNRLAEECVKRAKQRGAENAYATGVVDFQVVTSASGTPAPDAPFENLRPYTLDQLEALLADARALRSYPSSQLQAMYEGLFDSRERATLICLLAIARARTGKRALLDFLGRTGSLTEACLPPWTKPRPRNRTGLADLVEIMPFTPERR